MSQDTASFIAVIEPFLALWQKLRISGIAVLRNGRWISLSLRIALSHLKPEPEVFIQPSPDFIGFSKDSLLTTLSDLLRDIASTGSVSIQVGNEPRQIFLTLAYANSDPNPSAIQLGTPFSTSNHQHENSFQLGDIEFRLAHQSVENHYGLMPYEKITAVSSKLRVQKQAFGDVLELIKYLKVPYDRNQNYTSFEVVAPLPFSMVCSDAGVSIRGPRTAMKHLRVIGFFDNGKATVRLQKTVPVEKSQLGLVSGIIPWPERSRAGKLYLYFKENEIGSVSIRRWLGTANWNAQVQEFFDSGREILKAGLEARKKPEDFELAVVRLLNELHIPAIWYGDRLYQDRPDMAACIEIDNKWIVILGECTGQKPSEKFTRLLTRRNELNRLLQGEIRVIPVVFSPSTLSSVDKRQGREDGIVLIGATELAELLQGADLGTGPKWVIEYIDSLEMMLIDADLQDNFRR